MNFRNKYKWLLPMVSFPLILLLMRIVHTHTITFAFLPWNLFLAFLPLMFSHWLNKTTDRVSTCCIFGLWLLFFPNAMYIVTDLFHLHDSGNVPKWFDLLLLFSAALTGVLMGLSSLQNIERFLRPRVSTNVLHMVIFFMFVLCGYGIYLGRYLRWNSWDIFTQPFGLLLVIAHDVRHPFRALDTWALTGLFATWLFLLYRYIRPAVARSIV